MLFRSTVISISLSLIAAFIPLLFMGGVVGRLFREFSVTLAFAIAISTVVSLSVTPMICAHYIRQPTSTSATPGNDASPTPNNAYALFAVGAENGQGSILTSPTGFSIAASNSTGQVQNPVDCEQIVFVRDLPASDTVSSVVSLSGTTYYSEVMMIVVKS